MGDRIIHTVLALKNQMSQPLEQIKKSLEQVSGQVDTAKREVDRHSQSLRMEQRALRSARAAVVELTDQYGENSDQVRKAIANIDRHKDAVTLNREQVTKSKEEYKRLKLELNDINKKYKAMTKGLDKLKNRFEKTMKVMVISTALLGATLTASVLTVGFGGLKELDQGARKVKSIAVESLKMKDIQEQLIDSSLKTGVSMNELSEAQYSAISAGVKANESMSAAIQSSKLAKAGFTDTNSALKLMTSTMEVFGLHGSEAMGQISDKLMMTQNLGVTTIGELSSSMGGLPSIAKAAGLGIDEMLGSVSALTGRGATTGEAATGLKAMITSIIAPSKQASELAQKLGIDFSSSALKTKGFSKFLQELKDKTHGNIEMMSTLMGGTEALKASLDLTSDNGLKKFISDTYEMKNSAGATAESYKVMQGSISNQIDKLKNNFKVLSTSMLVNQSSMIGEQLSNLNEWISNNKEQIRDMLEVIGEGIGKAISTIGSVLSFIKDNSTVFEILGTFIGTIYLITKATAVFNAVLAVTAILGAPFELGALAMVGVIALVVAGVVGLIKYWSDLVDLLKSGWKWVGALFSGGDEKKANIVPPDNKGETPKQFALGGIATSASIFGEAGPEIAIPLNGSPRSKGLLDQANGLIGDKSGEIKKSITNNFYGDFYGAEDFKEKIMTILNSELDNAELNGV